MGGRAGSSGLSAAPTVAWSWPPSGFEKQMAGTGSGSIAVRSCGWCMGHGPPLTSFALGQPRRSQFRWLNPPGRPMQALRAGAVEPSRP
jgi:hypothetical protein